MVHTTDTTQDQENKEATNYLWALWGVFFVQKKQILYKLLKFSSFRIIAGIWKTLHAGTDAASNP